MFVIREGLYAHPVLLLPSTKNVWKLIYIFITFLLVSIPKYRHQVVVRMLKLQANK